MTIRRMDNVLVVEDLDAVIAFSGERGMELEDRESVDGRSPSDDAAGEQGPEHQ